jgi:hypothetical protein
MCTCKNFKLKCNSAELSLKCPDKELTWVTDRTVWLYEHGSPVRLSFPHNSLALISDLASSYRLCLSLRDENNPQRKLDRLGVVKRWMFIAGSAIYCPNKDQYGPNCSICVGRDNHLLYSFIYPFVVLDPCADHATPSIRKSWH